MKLTAAAVTEGVMEALTTQVAPHVNQGFAAEALRQAIALIAITGRAADDAVAIRVAENARIRRFLGDGAAILADPDLAGQLRAAAGSADPGLKLSELDPETARLRGLLVALHAALEDQDDAPARALHAAIWRALRDFEMARAPRG